MSFDFGAALGLVLVIEGLLYALVPGHLRSMMATVQGMSDDQLRVGGMLAVAMGVGIVWLVQRMAT